MKMSINTNTYLSRRTLLITSAVAGAMASMPSALTAAAADSIRPFQVHFPDAALADMKRRARRRHQLVAGTRTNWFPRMRIPVARQSRHHAEAG